MKLKCVYLTFVTSYGKVVSSNEKWQWEKFQSKTKKENWISDIKTKKIVQKLHNGIVIVWKVSR